MSLPGRGSPQRPFHRRYFHPPAWTRSLSGLRGFPPPRVHEPFSAIRRTFRRLGMGFGFSQSVTPLAAVLILGRAGRPGPPLVIGITYAQWPARRSGPTSGPALPAVRPCQSSKPSGASSLGLREHKHSVARGNRQPVLIRHGLECLSPASLVLDLKLVTITCPLPRTLG